MGDSRHKRRQRGARRGRGPGSSGERHENGASPRNGSAAGRGRKLAELCDLGPFSVFCALHLGITEDDGFRSPDPERVARHFELTKDELQGYLREHSLTSDDLAAVDFDLESARLDIKVAPEGVSRVELARTMFLEVRNGRG